jgi:hypothetical protein
MVFDDRDLHVMIENPAFWGLDYACAIIGATLKKPPYRIHLHLMENVSRNGHFQLAHYLHRREYICFDDDGAQYWVLDVFAKYASLEAIVRYAYRHPRYKADLVRSVFKHRELKEYCRVLLYDDQHSFRIVFEGMCKNRVNDCLYMLETHDKLKSEKYIDMLLDGKEDCEDIVLILIKLNYGDRPRTSALNQYFKKKLYMHSTDVKEIAFLQESIHDKQRMLDKLSISVEYQMYDVAATVFMHRSITLSDLVDVCQEMFCCDYGPCLVEEGEISFITPIFKYLAKDGEKIAVLMEKTDQPVSICLKCKNCVEFDNITIKSLLESVLKKRPMVKN